MRLKNKNSELLLQDVSGAESERQIMITGSLIRFSNVLFCQD